MIEIALQALETAAVLVGVGFGLIQLGELKRQHEVQAGAAMLQSLQAPDAGRTMLLLVALPDDLSGADLRQRLGEDLDTVIALASMFESLGPLVARGHVPLDIYAEYYRGATVVCWRKLRRYVAEQRASGWSNLFEWFEWLAGRMTAIAPLASDVRAAARMPDWRGKGDYVPPWRE